MKPGITIVGLGPGDSQLWTLAAAQLLQEAGEVYLRTDHHPSAAEISATTYSFDEWYERFDAFEEAHQAVAAEIIRLGQRTRGVVFAVPGHPNIDDPVMPYVRTRASAASLPVTIIPGVSTLEAILTTLDVGKLSQLQIIDAPELASRYHPPLEPDRPALILNLHGQTTVTQIQQSLLNAYPDDFVVTLVQAPGTRLEQVWKCHLAKLSLQPKLDRLLHLYLTADKSYSGFSTFQETIAHLRSPEGCPWDRKQSHQSLRPYLLEETYEVLETIDADDSAALAEELGDLLLQILLHTQIATDNGEFKMRHVIDHINRKMLRRHPHVFGDVVVSHAGEVTANWEEIKKAEKSAKGQLPPVSSALDGVPQGLPALAQALAISKKAVRVGFEWPDVDGVLDKITEEAREVAEAVDSAHLESEIGDLLFSVVNLARWHGIDPESALRATNARFVRRFKKMEALVRAKAQTLSQLTIDDLDALWEEAKRSERE